MALKRGTFASGLTYGPVQIFSGIFLGVANEYYAEILPVDGTYSVLVRADAVSAVDMRSYEKDWYDQALKEPYVIERMKELNDL